MRECVSTYQSDRLGLVLFDYMIECVRVINKLIKAPQPQDISFDDWWEKVEASVAGDLRKGLNSLVILGAWRIWRHRNMCVFNGSSPSVAAALHWPLRKRTCGAWLELGAFPCCLSRAWSRGVGRS